MNFLQLPIDEFIKQIFNRFHSVENDNKIYDPTANTVDYGHAI